MTAASFNAEVLAFANETIVREAIELKRSFMLDLFTAFVIGTPVGNPRRWKSKRAPKGYVGGYHRGAWQMTSGEPAEGELQNRRDPSSAIAEAEDAPVTLEDVGWITNNGPAITRLEFSGWSKQAPDGWVRAAIERVRAVYDLRR